MKRDWNGRERIQLCGRERDRDGREIKIKEIQDGRSKDRTRDRGRREREIKR